MKIKHSKEWYFKAKFVLCWAAMALCILPSLIAAIVKLPNIVVTKNAESTLSGVFAAAIICAALPLYKAIIKLVKSPNAAVICWVLFALMSLVNSMTAETIRALTFVFAVAAVGNTLGAILFKISKDFDELWKYCGQVQITGNGGESV